MTTGLPKQPTFGSILIGISLFILALFAFLRLPDVVKYTGTALMFLPAKIGLIEMVMPDDVLPLSLAENPSSIEISSPGQYLLYLNNYDLLVIHDAVVAGNSKPWLKIQPKGQDTQIEVTLIGRGLSWYDTPFAPGRPVVTFRVDQPGTYTVIHPSRPDIAAVVPDTVTGKESSITFWVATEVVLIAGAFYYFFRKRTAAKRQLRADKLAENRARNEETWQRMRKRTEERRKQEDQPYWKKH
jgi:hypothetical protein